MHKKIVAIIIALGMVASTGASVLAQPSNDISSHKQAIQKNKSLFEKAQKKVEQLTISIEKLDNQIEEIYNQISTTNKKITKTEADIDKTQKSIKIAEKEIEDEQELFNQRMRTMYINGTDSYVEVILDSKSISDFISRVENVKDVISYDKKIIGNLTDKKETIEEKKENLEANKNSLVQLKQDNEEKASKLKGKKSEQDKIIKEARKQEALYADKIKASEGQLNAAMKRIEAMRRAEEARKSSRSSSGRNSSSKHNPSRGGGTVSYSQSNIVSYASNFIGTPYQWGATGPDTFDCSGFVQYVYAHNGVSLSRTTYTQINEGSYVSRDELQPGDLVFFGSGTPHHVGIYVGDNCYIHAPQTGDSVKVSPMTRGDYLSGRRIR